jgi:hypothetical protein
LDLEGVHFDVVMEENEPKKRFGSDAKYALEGVQADIVPMTSLENDVKVV